VSELTVAVAPFGSESIESAIAAGGGKPVGRETAADALVWLAPWDPDGLRAAVEIASPRWVQLSSAGVEVLAEAGVLDPGRTWTCAKGAYAEPVAEHALTLALAGLRVLPERIYARSWGRSAGDSLFDQPVTILGGGGIATSLLELLTPFRVAATVVRRSPLPDGHPLWGHPRCIITPHTADTPEMVDHMLAARVRDNVARFAAGQPLAGLVDPAAGY
jgi:phosphoglycerate dehydrogenase-like enzyme